MLTIILMTYYSQNYAGILGSPLNAIFKSKVLSCQLYSVRSYVYKLKVDYILIYFLINYNDLLLVKDISMHTNK